MKITPLFWIIFTAAVIALLVSDLLVRRQAHVSLRQALATTLGWIALSAGFGLWITWRGGSTLGLQFFTGYLIEYALSMDNVFIFILIFASFKIPAVQQHRILFWGVIGAMVMRGLMVAGGTLLLRHFEWVTYLFGAYILYAGLAMLFPKKETSIEENNVVRVARRFLLVSMETQPTTFVTRESGRLKFTLLFLVLVVIETTDLVFALDSVPAVFAVTRDPFIVYTSNICAILGLRSLYFLLADAMRHLAYLHLGLAGVLIFIGGKMIGENFYAVSTGISLLVVGGILALAIVVSLLKPKKARL